MAILNNLKLWPLLGIFLLNSPSIKNVGIPHVEIAYSDLNALNLERLRAINIFKKDSTNYEFINSMCESLNEKKDSVNRESVKKLHEKIKKTRNIKMSQKKYVEKGIYQDFIDLNTSLHENKKNIRDYEILSSDGFFQMRHEDKYFQKKGLENIVEGLGKIEKLEEISQTSENPKEKLMALTILNSSEYLPLINELSQKEDLSLDFLLTIISNESLGYPYIVGRTGDLNLFQVNPSNIPNLYRKMRLEKDSLYRSHANCSLSEFKEKVETDPKTNIVVGIYLSKLLKKESRNESHMVLLYHLGASKYL